MIAELILNAGSRPGITDIDKAVSWVNKRFKNLDLDRKLAVDALNNLLDSRKKGSIGAVQEQLRAIKQEARLDKSLRKRVDKLLTAIDDGTLATDPQKARKEVAGVLKALRMRRDVLGTINRLQEDIRILERNIKKRESVPGKQPKKALTQLETKLKAKRTELRTQQSLINKINQLRASLESKDFLKQTKQTGVDSPEVRRLKAERDELQRRINEEIESLKPRSPFLGAIMEVAHAQRAIKTSMDLSAVGIQGLLLGVRKPILASKAFVQSIKALRRKQVADNVANKIRSRTNAENGMDAAAGLHISELEGGLSKGEEFFVSKLVRKIPGLKQVVEASERAFVTYLNVLRAGTFDALLETLTVGGKPTIEEAKIIANYVNVASGRGDAKFLNKHASLLSTLFFSPRYAWSRFQYLLGQPIFKGVVVDPKNFVANFKKDRRARGLVAKEMTKAAMSLSLVYYLWWLSDGELEDDTTSSDFGKLKSGNTRINTSAGLNGPFVLLNRARTGEVQPLRRGAKKRRFGLGDAASFLRFKASPLVSGGFDLAFRADFKGDPITPGSFLEESFLPIAVQDIMEQFRENEIDEATALSMLSILGINTATFNPNRENRRRPERR